jgi:hypothetical protein
MTFLPWRPRAATSGRVTASHPNSEVKLPRVSVVLRWGTTREGDMLHVLSFFAFPSIFRVHSRIIPCHTTDSTDPFANSVRSQHLMKPPVVLLCIGPRVPSSHRLLNSALYGAVRARSHRGAMGQDHYESLRTYLCPIQLN